MDTSAPREVAVAAAAASWQLWMQEYCWLHAISNSALAKKCVNQVKSEEISKVEKDQKKKTCQFVLHVKGERENSACYV